MSKEVKKFSELGIGDYVYTINDLNGLKGMRVTKVTYDAYTCYVYVSDGNGVVTFCVDPNRTECEPYGYIYCGMDMDHAIERYKNMAKKGIRFFANMIGMSRRQKDVLDMLALLTRNRTRHHRVVAKFMFRK